jgi:hypothetical protein
MKRVNLQCVYDIPENRGYAWIAMNADGVLNGFENAPIRDYKLGMWQDCVTGSYGEPIPFVNWEKSVKDFSEMKDLSKHDVHKLKREKMKRANEEQYPKGKKSLHDNRTGAIPLCGRGDDAT